MSEAMLELIRGFDGTVELYYDQTSGAYRITVVGDLLRRTVYVSASELVQSSCDIIAFETKRAMEMIERAKQPRVTSHEPISSPTTR